MSDQDVNDLLAFLAESLKAILGDQLFLYLTGSLTYGDCGGHLKSLAVSLE